MWPQKRPMTVMPSKSVKTRALLISRCLSTTSTHLYCTLIATVCPFVHVIVKFSSLYVLYILFYNMTENMIVNKVVGSCVGFVLFFSLHIYFVSRSGYTHTVVLVMVHLQ